MLQRVQPYVAYGYPTREAIKDLIYKRGSGRVGRCRIPLTNNAIIETNLGKYNITCIEDLIEEIHTCGPHFKEANAFLWTFKLHAPRGGWRNKKRSYQEGGDAGNREGLINQLIRNMN
jgi:large subunit ribosomal protein L7e